MVLSDLSSLEKEWIEKAKALHKTIVLQDLFFVLAFSVDFIIIRYYNMY